MRFPGSRLWWAEGTGSQTSQMRYVLHLVLHRDGGPPSAEHRRGCLKAGEKAARPSLPPPPATVLSPSPRRSCPTCGRPRAGALTLRPQLLLLQDAHLLAEEAQGGQLVLALLGRPHHVLLEAQPVHLRLRHPGARLVQQLAQPLDLQLQGPQLFALQETRPRPGQGVSGERPALRSGGRGEPEGWGGSSEGRPAWGALPRGPRPQTPPPTAGAGAQPGPHPHPPRLPRARRPSAPAPC